ncbi:MULTISPECIES: dynamin family protein [Amycolatopsis]|uniref:Dynamin family protein n=1 Tax=Amycolatopsis echigonensis TaxID=2576905 RepID=A0A2N3WLH1_9PSEU|nr:MULTISPECIES: dynamin family protein [Amycolatopsis]MBB2500802.1 dynamin family protein [Amycolatopsis echigonensis]MCG3751241.1 dynamin family protein [Amycolatopsis sp. Poz14]PKV94705.1 dynamin family protein [Amycolatopsis niigatensis]
MTAALANLADLVRRYLPVERARVVDDAVSRALSGQVRVLVLGEAKRGKSTLVNTLFARDLLPTGALPVTSVATTVTVASTVDAEVRYRDGRSRPIGLDEVAELVSERGNPGNVRQVDTVRISAPSACLPAGTEVVDSPGTGSVHQANTEEAARARDSVDLAVLVVAADPPVSQAELTLAAEVMTTAAAAAVLVNKTDLVRPGDLAEIVAFTRAAVAGPLGSDVPVLPVSLRTGAPTELVAWLGERIARCGEADVVSSTARALRRETTAVLDGLRIEYELIRRSTEDSAGAVRALRAILDNARVAETAAVDHLHGAARRARADLDAAHERAVGAARAATREVLGAALPEQPARPETAADLVRHRIGDLAAGRCAEWFNRLGAELETAMHAGARQALSGLTADLARSRQAAAEVLGIRLDEVPMPETAAAPRLPVLELGPEVVWRELVTTALAHRLPAAIRRKRLHRHLVDWAANAVPRPFGRARSALQDWLQDNACGTERALAEIWRAQLAALERGLAEAARRESAGPDVQLDELGEQISVLDQAVRELDTTVLSAAAR